MTPSELKNGTALAAPPSARSIQAGILPPFSDRPPPPPPPVFEDQHVQDILQHWDEDLPPRPKLLANDGSVAISSQVYRALQWAGYLKIQFNAIDIVLVLGLPNDRRNRNAVASTLHRLQHETKDLYRVPDIAPATYLLLTHPEDPIEPRSTPVRKAKEDATLIAKEIAAGEAAAIDEDEDVATVLEPAQPHEDELEAIFERLRYLCKQKASFLSTPELVAELATRFK